MRGNPSTVPAPPSFETSFPDAGNLALIEKDAVPGVTHVVRRVDWSYDETPTGGRLKISFNSGAEVLLDIDIRASGEGFVDFGETGKFAGPNKDLDVALYAGTGTCTGKLMATIT